MMSYTNYLLYLILVLCFTTDVGTINFRGQRTSAQNRHQSVCDLDVYWKLYLSKDSDVYLPKNHDRPKLRVLYIQHKTL